MCGIVGYISPWANGFFPQEVATFRDMLVIDSLRGYDSTGVFGVSSKGNVEILKDAVTGAQFVTTKDFAALAEQATVNGQFLIGHNRWATRGDVNATNAHPFVVDDKIVLVHNGTMRDDHKKHADVEVDSHAIAHILAKEDDVEKALSSIDAAFALVWYNVKTKSLHMIRNDERPLYIADVTSGGILFASEAEFILLAANRNNQKLKAAPAMLPKHVLHTYKLDEDKTWEFSEEVLNIDNKPWWQNNMNAFRRYYEMGGSDDDAPFVNTPSTGSKATYPQKEVTTTFQFYCYNRKLDDYQTDMESAKGLMATCDLATSTNHHIQLVDYLPVNEHIDCRAWYIWGHLISADDNEPKRVYYTKVEDKTEEEILAMVVKQEFYTVNAASVSIMHVDRVNVEKAAICAVMFTEEVPLSILTNENLIEQ